MGPTVGEGEAEAHAGGRALLRCSLRYAIAGLRQVTPAQLSSPTPCGGWDLSALLRHLDDALAALTEATEAGWIGAGGVGTYVPGPCLSRRVRGRAFRLLASLKEPPHPPDRRVALVDGWPLGYGTVAATGAIEVAVHGWDVARACGRAGAVPPELAVSLLGVARRVVVPADRPARFAAPLPPPAGAVPGDRLLAFLGRRP